MKKTQLPKEFIWAVLVICVLPFLLNLLGISFASPKVTLDFAKLSQLSTQQSFEVVHNALSGSFTHTFLEWSAVCTAFFTALLSFIHFQVKRDVVTPIIGVALFVAGCMDAFHVLAADRLIAGVANQQDLVPFTWAICRLFNAVILICGAGIFIFTGAKKWRGNLSFVVMTSLGFGLVAYLTIVACTTTPNLPQTTFLNSPITRPWDVIPLLLFAFAGLFILPKFYQQYPSIFSHSLIISTIPSVVTQMHMAFGSTALFDNHFNIGHFLKIIAYLVPFIGLSLEYIQTYRQEATVIKTVATSSQLISAALEHQERMAIQQATAVNQTTTTMDELGAFSHQSDEQAAAAAAGTREVLALVDGTIQFDQRTTSVKSSLREKVEQITDQIINLREQTHQISNITNLVSDIAEQTNMLALNAAVEAARAGVQGKSFAVVAAEIRKLADKSRKSAEQIHSVVASIQNATNTTVEVTKEGNKTLESVVAAINDININTQQISLNAKQQAIAIQQVVDSMTILNQGAAQAASSISETKVGLQQLNESLLNLAKS
ncbi:methyl-accepting chemotaxis sensory transducer [Crinalium epipsammum PCC 9333]|uniref:Methyl-accepting chemotaxis sensory transducer n=1 Tax=Crinalium epipsammum PCC 9333 TaxID=1173022 RepID=K9W6Q9_9CYAN|nr:methyl-accepting chemotaxis protein [Crinalium epipsammum]AFZ15135.1 methyl-accepting chemotaxis sensory transducer [Crinalium epipsammum PCC 9333]